MSMYLILLLFVLVFVCSFFYLKKPKEGFETNMHDILPVSIGGTTIDPTISVPNKIFANKNELPFNFGGDLITKGKLTVQGSLLDVVQDMKVGKNVDVSGTVQARNVDVSGTVYAGNVFKNQHSALPPVGSIMAFAGTGDPDGWVICDGVVRTETDGRYNRLITLNIGSGIANITYTPPNLKGQFLKGADSTVMTPFVKPQVTLTAANMPSHTHTGNTGAMSANASHDHAMTVDDSIVGVHSDCNYTLTSSNHTCGELNLQNHKGLLKDKRTGKTDIAHTHPLTIDATGGGTAFSIPDPSNYSVNYILKY